ncbi:MAG: trypsin-like peptidase domain-containing protein [Thermoplasmata archaeon]|nr:trypsin-like peptidase domain-containing protein [Thermoplasmata archaeon]
MSFAAMESELIQAVDRLRPAVVQVHRSERRAATPSPLLVPTGTGSGTVWDRDGSVVTNEHVVHDADALAITLPDGEVRSAQVLGADPLTDLALIRVEGGGLTPAPRGRSADLRIGQIALAIGNALGLPGGPSVSVGVVSALNRPLPGSDFVLEGLLQTDAAVNPGNSGGPLADLRGAVIGINTAVVPFAQGVGFAVPVDTVATVVAQLQRHGRVVRPWLGIQGIGVDRGIAQRVGLRRAYGVLVREVDPRGPAARAGLRPEDIVTRVGSTGVHGFRELVSSLAELPVGGTVEIAFERSGEARTAILHLVEQRASVRTSSS